MTLVVFDLDGTLLGADNKLSAASVDALAEARTAGLTIVAATGRSHWAAEMVLRPTDAIDHVVCSNGAVLYRRCSPQPAIMVGHTIDAELLNIVHKSVAATPGLVDVCWAWETEAGIVPDAGFAALNEWADLDELRASPSLTLPGGPELPIARRLERFGDVFRLLVAHPGLPRDALVGRLDGVLKQEAVELAVASSSAVFLEVTAQDVDKATGLQDYCRRLDVEPADVVAYGDHHNDLPMLRWAGRGIAMANADRRVLDEFPEHTTATNADDGAARALRELVRELGLDLVAAEDLDTPVGA